MHDSFRCQLGDKYDPENLLLKDMIIMWSENKDESIDKDESVDLSDIAPLESDNEEVKDKKVLKILTPNKLIIRLPISS